MIVTYVVDGVTYSYDLDESKVLNSLNDISIDLSKISFIDWNTSFDVPITMPQGFGDGNFSGFDAHYQNGINAVSYLTNMSKSQNKEDYDRWYEKFRDTIQNELIYETNILTKEIERFKVDYGTITNTISQKLGEVISLVYSTNKLLKQFDSMAKVSKVLDKIGEILGPLSIIFGTIETIDSQVKQAEMPKREQSILIQAKKVENLIEAYNSDALYQSLNRFEPKLPKTVTSSLESNSYTIIFIVFILVLLYLLYKRYY